MAVRLINEARQHHLTLDLATLFAAPELHALASRLDQGSDVSTGVIIFRESGSQRPLFIVPESSGELLYGSVLTAAIDADIPVYGLVAPDRNQPTFKTVQGAAAHYVEGIRQAQPEGPYRLAGWSFGGTMAYEIAAQLLGQDQSIEFLGLLDTWAMTPAEDENAKAAVTFETPEEEIAAMSRELLTYQAEHMMTAKVTPEEVRSVLESTDWRDHFALAQKMDALPVTWSADYFYQWLCHRRDLLNAEYEFIPLPVQLDLFMAQENNHHEAYLGWDQVLSATSIQVTAVPGPHHELMSLPYVTDVGAAISLAIAARATACEQDVPALNHLHPKGIKRPKVTICRMTP
ncbi:thioesterase domain-containing protein [Vibrio sp. PP-XX7]